MSEKKWKVSFLKDFKVEFDDYHLEVKKAILAASIVLQKEGPDLGRPHVDTLNDSDHANMKELRCDADNGVWRVAFAFDPERKAILLAAGDKAGTAQKRFYKSLIKKADARYVTHLNDLKGRRK